MVKRKAEEQETLIDVITTEIREKATNYDTLDIAHLADAGRRLTTQCIVQLKRRGYI